MKTQIESLLRSALLNLHAQGVIETPPQTLSIESTRDKNHGDLAANIALLLAKSAKMNPRALAEKIVKEIPPSIYVSKIEIAGPGFINFFLSSEAMNTIIPTILKEKENYGRSLCGQGKKVILEFVSTNPTGPLHVGHGRHGAVGSVLANLLNTVGFKTYKEYYVNDGGRQMNILAVSIWIRYLNTGGQTLAFPVNGYKGSYIEEIALALRKKVGTALDVNGQDVLRELPHDENEGGDKEVYIDALIERCQQLLGSKFDTLFQFGLESILADNKEDLAAFGVTFDNWFSEQAMIKEGKFNQILKKLQEKNLVYRKDGALWFASSTLGDEKDRVIVRANGQQTYFANDIAYHISKFERGFDIAIGMMGSDHHGYLPRMKAAIRAFDIDPERLVMILLQFVTLYRQGELVSMSTRGGNFVTLRELREEVGNDAVRFFYLLRKSEQPIDFDMDLAMSQSNENPVYYVQYAYARICSVFKQLEEKQLSYDEENGLKHLALLIEPQEKNILNTLGNYPDMIINAAITYEPHQLTTYLRKLAGDFHTYYNSHQFLVNDKNLRDARLALITSIAQVLFNGFNLLGISAPKSM